SVSCTQPSHCCVFLSSLPAPSRLFPLSLRDALPISARRRGRTGTVGRGSQWAHPPGPRRVGPGHGPLLGFHLPPHPRPGGHRGRSEEHTSELQSRENLV